MEWRKGRNGVKLGGLCESIYVYLGIQVDAGTLDK